MSTNAIKTGLALWVFLAACGQNSTEKKVPRSVVAVFVDGVSSGTISVGGNSTIDELLSEGTPQRKTWTAVEVRSRGRFVRLEKLNSQYKNYQLFLEQGSGGAKFYGRKQVADNAPPHVREIGEAPQFELSNVESFHIETREKVESKEDEVVMLPLVFLRGEQKTILTEKELKALPAFQHPEHERRQKNAIPLLKVVETQIKVSKVQKLIFHNNKGEARELMGSDWKKADSPYALRPNSRGVWSLENFSKMKNEDRFRGVETIEVVAK